MNILRNLAAGLVAGAAFASAGFAGAASAQTPGVQPRLPQTSMQSLRAMPPDTKIRTTGGREVRAADVVKMTDALRDLSAKRARLQPRDMNFARPTGPAAVKLERGADLQAIAQRSPNTVLELPSGLKITVADLRKLADFEQRRSGRSILRPAAGPSRAGPAIKVNTLADIDKLKSSPDSTVVENAKGARATLGEVRAARTRMGR